MTITHIEYITKLKAKIYIDEAYRFLLTKREINQYKLFIGKDIDDMALDEILTGCILDKAKKKAMDLLVTRDRTETELRRGLKSNQFTEDMINLAIDYVKQYNYIDNRRYVENYLAYRAEGKSIQMIKYELKEKGIPPTLYAEVLEEYDYNDLRNIQKIILKKYGDSPSVSIKEKQKFINYLLRKGYQYSDIVDCIKHFNINNE